MATIPGYLERPAALIQDMDELAESIRDRDKLDDVARRLLGGKSPKWLGLSTSDEKPARARLAATSKGRKQALGSRG